MPNSRHISLALRPPSCSRNDLTIWLSVNLLVFIIPKSNCSTFHRSSFSGGIQKEIDKENEAIQQARSKGARYKPLILSNGDTPKQLLARSRYLLYKLPSQWTQSQLHRVGLLFQLYPSIEKAYRLAWDFRSIYNAHSKEKAIQLFQDWIRQAKDIGIDHFNTASEAVLNHFEGILAFFNNRSTNAHAESLNAQIKLFRANLRGVSNTKLFLYRLRKVFA